MIHVTQAIFDATKAAADAGNETAALWLSIMCVYRSMPL